MKKLLLAFAMLSSALFASDAEKVVLTKSNTLVFNEVFYSSTVANLSQRAQAMDAALPAKEPIYLILDTPGGSIQAGVEFCSFVAGLNRPVHTVSIFSASMGFHTAQCVKGTRYIFDQGILMSHKAYGGFEGEFPGQLDSRYNMYLQRITDMDNLVVARTKGKYTLSSYRDLIENEYWCVGKKCVEHGFADSVLVAKCDNTLNGTRFQVLDKFLYDGMVIEIGAIMSNCPLITGFLEFKIFVDGEPLFTIGGDGARTEEQKTYFKNIPNINKHVEAVINSKIQEFKDGAKNRKVVKGY
jgi:ATP-dependent protease ClpP protease subunit